MGKNLTFIVCLFALNGCVTPGEEAQRNYELIRLDRTYNPKQCRIACDNAMRSFNPLTGECKCYPPEYLYKKRKTH